jgi:hypothetical protein
MGQWPALYKAASDLPACDVATSTSSASLFSFYPPH